MKRNFAALMLLLIPALMTSCWKTGEDWSLCGVDDNFILKFSIRDGDGTFQANINSVDIFLFDADRYFLEHKRVDKAELEDFQGATFSVPPGTYHVVCWANADENSCLSDMDENCNIDNSYIEIVSAVNGCPFYYAPYKTPVTRSGSNGTTRAGDYSLYSVEVLPNKETVKELAFAKAHREVRVFVRGFENTTLYDGKSPVTEQTGTGGKYDFLLHADLTPHTLRQTTVFETTKNGDMFLAGFYSTLIPVRGDMDLYLYHPTDGSVLGSVNLKQYIADNGIADDSMIPVLFSFDPIDASVSVTMPSWLDNPVDPGM